MNKRRVIVFWGALLFSAHALHGWGFFWGSKQEQPSKQSIEWFNNVIADLNDIRSQIKDLSFSVFINASDKTINEEILGQAHRAINEKFRILADRYGRQDEIEKKLTEEQRKIYTPLAATTVEEAQKFLAAIGNMIETLRQQQPSLYPQPQQQYYYQEQPQSYQPAQQQTQQKETFDSEKETRRRAQELVAKQAKELVAKIKNFYIPNPSTLSESKADLFIKNVIELNNEVALQLRILGIEKYGPHYHDIDTAYTAKINAIEEAVSKHFGGDIYVTIETLKTLPYINDPGRFERYNEISNNVAILKQVIDSIPSMLTAKLNFDGPMSKLKKALEEAGAALARYNY